MLINTRDFGEVEIADEELITFPAGIFAFEEMRKFALMSPLGEDVYPKWLQSVEDISPCFVVFDPTIVDGNYTVKLEAFEKKLLKFDDNSADNMNSSMKLLVIATVPSDFKKTTVNMKAPIVINQDERLAAQVILNLDYEFKFPLYSDDSDDSERTGE
ncbi:MAG: flagellar assembly protein FliW [Oscillospiraceae bacterium]|nr:flagellar assembly protein FliW [Oscillospiraceae bacterium]